MLVNLSELFTNEGRVKHCTLDTEMKRSQASDGVYEIISQEPVGLKVTNVGDRALVLEEETGPFLMIPCDHCLEPVRNDFHFTIERTLDMKLTEEGRLEDLDEQPYLRGYSLDVDQLVRDELLLNLPMEILYNEDCKGICDKCGVNLSHETCECGRSSLDPRASVIQNIFK